jgi:hypothetical protein
MRVAEHLAHTAIDDSLGNDARAMQVQILADAALALIALLAATTLSVYKPRGTTAYGRRRLASQ